MQTVHGTCVSIDGFGLLLRGAPGSGKSDLALRLIDHGARLVADDRVVLDKREGGLWASAPAALAGLLEVRGVGIIEADAIGEAPVRLIVDLVAPEQVERLPERDDVTIQNVSLPLWRLAPFEASAPLKLQLVVRGLRGDIIRPTQSPS